MQTIIVEKMTCGGCARRVEAAARAAGATAVTVELTAQRVTIDDAVEAATIAQAIPQAGYPARVAAV